MGRTRREMMGFIFILLCFSMATSSNSLQQIISTTESNYDHQQTNLEKHGKDKVTNRIGRKYSASAITVPNRVGQGNSGTRGGGDGGGSRSHTGGGGAAIIPIYAAGSAQARRHQGRPRNAGTRHENNMGLRVAAVLAAITHMYRVF